jgi:hypothetical protein
MSDYRNPNDLSRRDSPYDPNAPTSKVASGWIAAGVFLVLIIALAFGIGHMPNHAGNNTVANNAPPPATQPAQGGPASRTYSPTPMSPAQNPNPSQPQP